MQGHLHCRLQGLLPSPQPARSSPAHSSASSGLLGLWRGYGTSWEAGRPEGPETHTPPPARQPYGCPGSQAWLPPPSPLRRQWGHRRDPRFPPTPSARRRVFLKPTAFASNPRAFFPAPAGATNQSLAVLHPPPSCWPNRAAPFSCSPPPSPGRRAAGGLRSVGLVFPKRGGGVALPCGCLRRWRSGRSWRSASRGGCGGEQRWLWRPCEERAGAASRDRTGPGPGRRSVKGAGKRAETSRRSACDWGAGRGAETWLQLGARFVGPERGCSPATAQWDWERG